MAIPLPPIPVGPIFTTSPLVKVTGTLPGASVQIFAAGQPSGQAVGAIGKTWVRVTGRLQAGQAITATQKTNDGQSPSNINPILVIEPPKPLPLPDFWSALSEAMGFVWMGQLVPGAELTLTVAGTGALLVRHIATRTDEVIELDKSVPLVAGDILVATQILGSGASAVISGPHNSLPLFQANKEPTPPRIVEPIESCQTSLQFIQVAASGEVKISNEGQKTWWLGADETFTGYDAPPLKAGALEVHEEYAHHNLSSKTAVFTVLAAGRPAAPEMQNVICKITGRVGFRKLVPGAILQILAEASNTGEAPTNFPVVVAEAGVDSAEQWFELPASLLPAQPAGGSVWVTARQSLCGQISISLSPNFVYSAKDTSTPPPKIVEPVYDCAAQISVEVALTLNIFQAFLDNGSPLSDPVSCLDASSLTPRLIINLYRPLHAGEIFHVAQTGCLVANQSTSVKVKALPTPLPEPLFAQHIRPGSTLLSASDIIPGSRVSLYVNNQWRTTVRTLESTVYFGVVSLKDGDRVSAIQTRCNQYSIREPIGAVVSVGKLNVAVAPPQVVRAASTTITVSAADKDTNAPVTGAVVLINGAMVGVTGKAFVFSPPKGLPAAAGLVQSSPAYSDATFSIALRDPPPPPPPPPPVKPLISLTSNGDGSFVVTGSGFKANATVNIRVVDDALTTLWFKSTSSAQGAFTFPTGHLCQRPGNLHFSANDGRPDSSDTTGLLWSNTVTVSCPL
jgi:hypothetical protein